ncbi:MAG: hypothetical protein EOP83_00585 [Verrucomicrobiaceae bacterium]|nr:MAG: hypothetical protein EOP83_00585 [Verrucomicrobiaceae bacterium]
MTGDDLWLYILRRGYYRCLPNPSGLTEADFKTALKRIRKSSPIVKSRRIPKTYTWVYSLEITVTLRRKSPKDSYVYRIINPTNNIPLYFGIGQGKRKDIHLSGKSHNEELNQAVRYLRSCDIEPVAEILQHSLTRDAALEIESNCIRTYGRRGIEPTGILFNRRS